MTSPPGVIQFAEMVWLIPFDNAFYTESKLMANLSFEGVFRLLLNQLLRSPVKALTEETHSGLVAILC
ncbi:MAG TPA: hypothetical protein VH682_00425 [Gemmataceae bacterium]